MKHTDFDVVGQSYDQAMIKKSRLALVPAIAAMLILTGCTAPTTVEKADASADVEPADKAEPEPAKSDEGSRSNPYPIGTKAISGDWFITIDSIDFNGTDAVLAHNEFNEPPADGNVYILVTATTGYLGTDDSGQMPFGNIDYISTAGNTISQSWLDSPGEDFTSMSELYIGATHTGNMIFEVPADSAADGVFAVKPDMLADKVFVSLK